MIGKTVFPNGREYVCDRCGEKAIFKSYEVARKADWAVSWERTLCYCPKCAPDYRRGGAKSKNKLNPPQDGGQLSIDNLLKGE